MKGAATASPGLLRRLRLFQIRATAALVSSVSSRRLGRAVVIPLRSFPLTRALLDFCLGFRRTFPSFAAAQACASRFIPAGHDHPDEIRFHSSASDIVRESDYPVLFHLASFAPELHRIFDLGGNVGNLFYAYQLKMSFPRNMRWIVFDLPVKKPIGEKLAEQRGETRIDFCDSLDEASGSDVFIASGSLHYFEKPLHALLSPLKVLPKHVFVNRSPFSAGGDLITVQDNRSYLVPCKLHSRAAFISGMQSIGYELQAQWPVHERRLIVPMHPDSCERTYSGFYFRKI